MLNTSIIRNCQLLRGSLVFSLAKGSIYYNISSPTKTRLPNPSAKASVASTRLSPELIPMLKFLERQLGIPFPLYGIPVLLDTFLTHYHIDRHHGTMLMNELPEMFTLGSCHGRDQRVNRYIKRSTLYFEIDRHTNCILYVINQRNNIL